MYCVHNSEVHLKGSRMSKFSQKENSYLIYVVARCSEKHRNKTLIDPTCTDGDMCETVDPECAPEAEIDDWTRTKKNMLFMINNKI